MAANKTLQNKKQLIDAMEQSLGVVTQACKMVGISRVTYYDYYNNDPEFKAAIDELQNVALDFAESQLHKQIREGSTGATIFYLKTKGKNRGYIERQEIQHDTDTGFNIKIVDATRD
jgi:hypothetical protein